MTRTVIRREFSGADLARFWSALTAGADAVTQTRGDSMSDQAALRSITIVAIRPSPYQYRTRFDDEKQRQLVESLRSTGLSTPILVRPLAEAGAGKGGGL